ncbi:hypothetical protein [Shewanella surugensis]|uniref:Uncharacterized protein n=1 Tax=Shewanella surugensis TaxID=212020 RepID=A0ABT0LI35_9GAMM|nr:hypothetical protein [Shewanella surugensis]MCL1127239.1 hypothetical protein [Shewanella surugensis]
MNYLSLAKQIATEVKAALIVDLKNKHSFYIDAKNEADTKSTHHADSIAYQVIKTILAPYQCQIYMEGFQYRTL